MVLLVCLLHFLYLSNCQVKRPRDFGASEAMNPRNEAICWWGSNTDKFHLKHQERYQSPRITQNIRKLKFLFNVIIMAGQPITYPVQKYGLNKALLRETNGQQAKPAPPWDVSGTLSRLFPAPGILGKVQVDLGDSSTQKLPPCRVQIIQSQLQKIWWYSTYIYMIIYVTFSYYSSYT